MNAKYKVGLVVILQSIPRPDLNGEYTIKDVFTKPTVFMCRVINKITTSPLNNSIPCYRLEECVISGPCTNREDKMIIEVCWDEGALRKKHIPGEYSFDQLVNTLDSPVDMPCIIE